MRRPPYTVQVMNRHGVWESDQTSRRLSRLRDRLLHLTRSPRRQAVARIVDRDGRNVA